MKILQKILNFTLLIVGGLLLTSCSSINVSEYKDQKPDFDFENFFSGELEANGVFQSRSGKIIKKIHCIMKAEKKTVPLLSTKILPIQMVLKNIANG